MSLAPDTDPEEPVPTYQYSCTECGHFFEQVQSFTEDSLTVCPECQGRLRKVFNAVGVVFKGSGFYRTDSRAGDGSSDGGAASSTSKGKDTPAPTGDSGSTSTGASTSTGSSGSSGPSGSSGSAATAGV